MNDQADFGYRPPAASSSAGINQATRDAHFRDTSRASSTQKITVSYHEKKARKLLSPFPFKG
jgi:hypothetical protein